MNIGPALVQRLRHAWLLAGLALLSPQLASAYWNHDWSYRKQITIDPASAGLSFKGDLADVPVLVRLHEGVFKFSDANADGSDLRFVADDDRTPLRFHIEKYDSVFNLAYIWVSIPKVHGADKTSIWLYYGNSRATAGSEPRETYDPDQVLVYHFAERGTAVTDSTGYANNSTSTVGSDDAALIGNGARFSGQSVVLLPASSSLALAAGAASTIAFWIKPTVADADAVLYARHDGGRVLQIGLNKGAPYVAIGNAGAAPTQTSPGLPLGEKAWHQLAVTTGAKVTLFVDGQEKATLELPAPALNAAASLGGDAAAGEGGAVGPIASAYTGELDELEISKSARDPSYLQLLAANQGAGNKLVSFGPDQQLSSWSSGYVGIILRSVTFDGWVVIAILIVMAVLSWVVMFLKARQISRAADGNHAFMKLFRRLGGDFSALNHAVAGAPSNELRDSERVLVQNAPLFRMFGAGVNELRNRASSEGNDSNRTTPSAASLDAIRASLDASLVDELDAFDDRMVILTIAISGGPFLGLLGTVVGVMITFAAIAASGDVNVNSIAPGIAAALVATVAGLLVAIPALFGYNYLMSRIRRMSAQMQVFVDTFITRSTESYGRDTGNGPIASLHPSPAARPTIVR